MFAMQTQEHCHQQKAFDEIILRIKRAFSHMESNETQVNDLRPCPKLTVYVGGIEYSLYFKEERDIVNNEIRLHYEYYDPKFDGLNGRYKVENDAKYAKHIIKYKIKDGYFIKPNTNYMIVEKNQNQIYVYVGGDTSFPLSSNGNIEDAIKEAQRLRYLELKAVNEPEKKHQPTGENQEKLQLSTFETISAVSVLISLWLNQYLTIKNGKNSNAAIASELLANITEIINDYAAFINSNKTSVDYCTFTIMAAEAINSFICISKLNQKEKMNDINEECNGKKQNSKILEKLSVFTEKSLPTIGGGIIIYRVFAKKLNCQETCKYLTLANSLLKLKQLYTKCEKNKKLEALVLGIAIISIVSVFTDNIKN